MFRNSTHAGAASRSSFVFRLGLAVALASGTAFAAAPAFAKDEKPAKEEGNSKAFADAYAPMQKIINNPAGDFASAKAMIPTIQATIQNDTDKNTFGQALIALGDKLNDVGLQKQGAQLALESGKAGPQAGVFHYYLGKWAYGDKNYTEALSQLQAAAQAGYAGEDAGAIMADSYFGLGQNAQGLQYLSSEIQKRAATGQPAPETYYRRGLGVAYRAKMAQQADDYAMMLVQKYPTPDNWQAALQVLNALGGFDPATQLDLFRLMRQTGSLKAAHDYLGYINAADPMKLSNEALAVINQGVSSGVLSAGDVQGVKSTAEARAAANKAAADSIAEDARSSPNGKIAIAAGDQYLSLGSNDKAAEMYQLAVSKGGADKDLALTRLGIAQAEAGQLDAAKGSFQQVTGARAPVAKMWIAYIESKSGAPTPPTPPTPPAPPGA